MIKNVSVLKKKDINFKNQKKKLIKNIIFVIKNIVEKKKGITLKDGDDDGRRRFRSKIKHTEKVLQKISSFS